jgi:hypothetical protein
VATQKGIITSQQLRSSGRKFLVADAGEMLPCYQDRWSGEWMCGHDHSLTVPLEDAYQWFEGWTAQERL